MKFSQRVYAPFNSMGERIDPDPGHLIAYYARSFKWIDTDLTVCYDDAHDKIRTIFALIDEAAKAGDCERRRMGCVVTDSRLAVLATGANVKPDGLQGNCKEIGCIPAVTCRLTIHAEVTALNNLAKVPLFREPGLTLFNTAVPCLDCMKFCRANRISTIIYQDERDQPEYDRPIMSALTLNSGIVFVKVEL